MPNDDLDMKELYAETKFMGIVVHKETIPWVAHLPKGVATTFVNEFEVPSATPSVLISSLVIYSSLGKL